MGGNLVTWRSKKQSVVARSSAEAEYRVIALGIFFLMDKETCIEHKKQQSCPEVHGEYTKRTKPG